MDRVRLGRVLGRGARMAARTVYDAVDAATTPSAPAAASTRAPSSQVGKSPNAQRVASGAGSVTAAAKPAVRNALHAAGRLNGSVRSARQGVLAPVKRASRAVSLEIAGSFYALFALSFAAAAWRFRGNVQLSLQNRLWIYVSLATLFGYFALSSFLRARRISRG